MNGLLIVNKEPNYTSRDIVNIISKKFKTKKIGHTGTLDPMATGVLVLCIGSSTKLVEVITNEDKEYVAEVTLGTLTDTGDITGKVIKEENTSVSKEEIIDALKKMIGIYNQQVPIYSAVKINGKKLYEYARENKAVDLPERLVNIKELELISDIKTKEGKTTFKIRTVVSKGTYIRSLIEDIASKLKTIGTMSELERTRQGVFKIADAYSLNDIDNDKYNIINPLTCLNNYKQVIIDERLFDKIKNGSLIKNLYNEDIVVFKNNNDKIIAIYKKYDKNEELMKPWKMFNDEGWM